MRSLILCLTVSCWASAQTPSRVADFFNTGRLRGSDLNGFAAVNGNGFFTFNHPAMGWELWTTDGTPTGTRAVLDLRPGVASSAPWPLTPYLNSIFFLADATGGRRQLWRSDGTTPGTLPVGQVNCSTLGVVNGVLYCVGEELWRSDGTEVGTVLVRALTGSGGGSSLVQLGTNVCFRGRDGELWVSNGSNAGTQRVVDLRPSNSTGSIRSELVVMGARVYFVADDGVSGLELWSSDGTAAGTSLVRDVVVGSGSGVVSGITISPMLFSTGARLFFFGNGNGIELFTSDGTNAGTVQVADLTAGTGSTFSATSELFPFGGKVYFAGPDGELWSSDGTSVGTAQLVDLLPGATRASPQNWLSSTTYFSFSACSSTGFPELWRSDGTVAGTTRLGVTARNSPASFGSIGTLGVWLLDDDQHGVEPWLTDGTPGGTRLLMDLSPGLEASSFPHALARLGDALVFVANTQVTGGATLVRTMGTAASSSNLKTGLSNIVRVVSSATRAWFINNSSQLWTSDGSAGGTVQLKQFDSGFGATARDLTVVGDVAYFAAGDQNVWGVWRSDGTVTGTRKVADGSASQLTKFGDRLYFVVSENSTYVLWRTDGTAAGTTLVHDFGAAYVKSMVAVGSKLFIAAGTNALWVSDGTSAATTLVGAIGSTHEVLALDALGSTRVVLRLLDTQGTTARPDDEAEVWVSDGTLVGTTSLAVLAATGSAIADGAWAQPRGVEFGGRLFFPFVNGGAPSRLWVTDGSVAGTHVLKVLSGAQRGDLPSLPELISTPRGVFFAASDGTNGCELWRTDGTDVGTALVADLVVGAGSSSPRGLLLEPPFLYFSAFDAAGDNELWSLDLQLDDTPPVIRQTVTGTAGLDGWFTSNVTVRFDVTDGESPVSSSTGCEQVVVSADTTGVTFTCTATSAGGTSTSTVTVRRDATAPVLTCEAALEVEATSSSGAVVTFALPTASDAVTASPVSGSTFALGVTNVVFSSTDVAGNRGTCMRAVTVVDTTPPVITCPAAQTLVAGSLLTASASATDLVDSAPRLEYAPALGSVAASGLVTATATDASGNSATCTFAVTVTTGSQSDPMPMPMPSGCGCNGLEGLVPFALLALVRRRRAQLRDNAST